MNRYPWLVIGFVALTFWTGVNAAEAGVIFPVSPTTGLPNTAAPVTVSLFTAAGQDVTDDWLPTWNPVNGGNSIFVSFNVLGVAVPATSTAVTVTLKTLTSPVFNGTTNPHLALPPTTSAYPGQCTNYSSPTAPSDPNDFTFDAVATTTPLGNTGRIGFALTSQDCGGMAVIEVTVVGVAGTHLFVLPQDSNRNGIPDIVEARLCPQNSCPTGREDNDAGPVTPSPLGDGIAAFDEYRGFIVGGQHVSTDPRLRDVFLHLVKGQCGADTLLGGGTQTFPSDGTGLFDNLANLVPGTQVHLLASLPGQLKTDEWVDRFASFAQLTGFRYLDDANNVVSIAPAVDRRINKNAVFPLGITNPGGTAIQKGVRVTECLDVPIPLSGPLGTTGLGTTNGPDNSILYTQRIADYFTQLIQNGAGRPLRVFTFQSGQWILKRDNASPDFVISEAMKFYAAHEPTHSLRLTPTEEGDRKTSYGFHHAPGTGSVMDQTIVQKIDKSGGFNSFYIPSSYNGADQGSYKVKD